MDRIVVPEGVAVTRTGDFVLSEHYISVIEAVANDVRPEEAIYLAPGNRFGGDTREDVMAASCLSHLTVGAVVTVPEEDLPRRYLDTSDNAVLLRRWLAKRGTWPIGEVVVYCTAAHARRVRTCFERAGFVLASVVGAKSTVEPSRHEARIVRRLWYYRFPVLHRQYERLALLHARFRLRNI